MEIHEIFEDLLKIEPKVMSIETLFNNPDRVSKTNYEPWYQRNYVWDDEKATYFIESILLGTEIPPLIYFRSGDDVEVIDGRQRYQTILRFINNEFKLKKSGLQKLENIGIAKKNFKDIGDLRDVFWDTKLRIIEFSFHSKNLVNEDIEEIVKKEIFKRYNSGITPLKSTDIDKAVYYEDDLNTFIRKKLVSDHILYSDVSSLFHFDKLNLEILLKEIRQLLVQHKIPIKYFTYKKAVVIAKYYEFLFSELEQGDVEEIYNGFIQKVNYLKKVKKKFDEREQPYNRLIFECLFWGLSILDAEEKTYKDSTLLVDDLVSYMADNIASFVMDRSSFAENIMNRYTTTARFFEQTFHVDLSIYLNTTDEFKEKNKRIKPTSTGTTSFDELRINKPEPSSIAIVDICRQMEKHRFLIRPLYQRNEVINKKKSSAIIESILLGIKLPPIFIFKRSDGISEVLDGQQRLLSILGFIEKSYLDENNNIRKSNKHGYALNLKEGILKSLNAKSFKQLSPELKNKIQNFDLWTIEINQKNNEGFEQIDLFIRLNNKPYPIKENTFEMWNSYISREIIEKIKGIYRVNKEWLYLRKNNSRMEDENVYVSLAYLQFGASSDNSPANISKYLDIYKVGDKVNFRIKSKNEISRVLEDTDFRQNFIKACGDFENLFVANLKTLLEDESSSSIGVLNKNLDGVLNAQRGRRTQQSFYALWYFLSRLDKRAILMKKDEIRTDLKGLFVAMSEVTNKANFDSRIEAFWEKYTPNV